MEKKASIINAIATDEGIDNLSMALVKIREDAVHTLHETVRTLLNGLRCQTLGFFRWYKDTYLSRVMELPKNKMEYWKAKVRKALRGNNVEIPYKDLTYGKIIGTCTQEGLNLCNELKMTRQLKMDMLREKSQLGDFCAQFDLPDPTAKSGNKDRSGRDLVKIKCYKCGYLGHIAPNCKQNKLKTLELDGETYEKVYGLLYTSGSNDNYEFNSGSDIELLDLSDNDNNDANPCTTCQDNDCNCENDEIYKLQLQFQDFNMNTITSDNVIELLKEIIDSKLREKIIDLAASNETSSSSSKPFENKKNDLSDFENSAPYSLKEAGDHFLKRNTFSEQDSSFDDLKIEVENLKREIKSLKQNQLIYPVTRDINALINMKQNHIDSLQMELFSMNIFDSLKYAKVQEKIKLISEMDLPWIHIKGRGRGRSALGKGPLYGAIASSSQGSSYRSLSNSPIIQLGKRMLINKKTTYEEYSSN
ncbi:hypothetical protein H5410_030201 [Solanum commersonii]|uniref:CCHC-type domain-containing protein n=1 Tax=Solanum commersonii TaxID=4109 RepID=A0A9J5YG67_SOLCO|nr:hypothetical protein H5410_030201 [Solanum commersonii]